MEQSVQSVNPYYLLIKKRPHNSQNVGVTGDDFLHRDLQFSDMSNVVFGEETGGYRR